MKESMPCNFCGNPVGSVITLEPFSIACRECARAFGTCAMCIHARECDFETNPSPLPKQVEKTIRQGNMIMQTVCQNEERVRETCLKNCKCFSEELGCLKENGTCGNYEEVNINGTA